MKEIIYDYIHCTQMEFMIKHPFVILGIVVVTVVLMLLELHFKKKDWSDKKHKKE